MSFAAELYPLPTLLNLNNQGSNTRVTNHDGVINSIHFVTDKCRSRQFRGRRGKAMAEGGGFAPHHCCMLCHPEGTEGSLQPEAMASLREVLAWTLWISSCSRTFAFKIKGQFT